MGQIILYPEHHASIFAIFNTLLYTKHTTMIISDFNVYLFTGYRKVANQFTMPGMQSCYGTIHFF